MDRSTLRRRSSRLALAASDLVLAGCLVAALFVAIDAGAPPLVRTVLGLVVLFVVPGYVLLAALFPRRSRDRPLRSGGRLAVPERIALAVGCSVALVPLFGHLLGVIARFEWRTELGFLGGFVAVFGVIALVRRLQVPPEERFYLPVGSWLEDGMATFGGRSLLGKVVLLALVGSILLSGTTVAYVLSVPNSGEQFTDLHLTTEQNGSQVSAGYPVAIQRGESATLTVGIHNFEGERTEYTVVATLERIVDSNGESRVVERRELDRFSTTVADGAHWNSTRTVTPPVGGDDLQLNYYLYRGEAPETATAATAYRHAYIWLDVTPANTTSGNATTEAV